jgi:hypothetical protein
MAAQPKQRLFWLWPLALMIGGGVLLLDNFWLIDVDLAPYWPVLLVVLGVQLLLRGDIGWGWQAHTFGITRGSVISGSLEIESGELDVQVRALRKPGRLIAGQYTARSRPELSVRNNHATLRMQRGQTWWLSLADWDVGLATDLPWSLLVSAYLGRLEVDLRGLVVDRVYISSGLGSVNVACPAQATGPIFARSALGDVRLSIPPDSRVIIHAQTGPLGRVRADAARFEQVEPGVYVTAPYDDMELADTVHLDVTASTDFGSIYIN